MEFDRAIGSGSARSDADLIAASRRGEHAAFGALVERYQDAVCAVTYSRTGDRALSEDVAQDTFLAAWRQLAQLHDTGKLKPWLCGIARHLASKARKRHERETPIAGELHAAHAHATSAHPLDEVVDAEAEAVVWDALARVPETYREALVLYYREHQSAREVARALGISEGAVAQRLARGRQHLAASVDELVERALRSRRRVALSAAVLAALPTIAIGSRVDAHPAHVRHAAHGGSMIKLALLASALAAATTTAVVATRADHGTAAAPTAPLAAAQPADAPVTIAPTRAASSHAAAPPRLAVAPSPSPSPTPAPIADDHDAPPPDTTPSLDRAELHRLGLDHGPSRGPADAPVTIVMFTDTICSYCGNVLGSIDQLWDEYPGKLQLIIKQFPVHPEAMLAAEAAYAADAQGEFWGMHELMFANQDALTEDALVGYARQLAMDTTRFRDALDHHTYHPEVAADQAAGKAAGVTGTPAFLINGRRVIGALPITELRKTIELALADC